MSRSDPKDHKMDSFVAYLKTHDRLKASTPPPELTANGGAQLPFVLSCIEVLLRFSHPNIQKHSFIKMQSATIHIVCFPCEYLKRCFNRQDRKRLRFALRLHLPNDPLPMGCVSLRASYFGKATRCVGIRYEIIKNLHDQFASTSGFDRIY